MTGVQTCALPISMIGVRGNNYFSHCCPPSERRILLLYRTVLYILVLLQRTAPCAHVSTPSSGASTTATQATTRTGVSTLTADTRTAVARIDNPAGDAEFSSITLRAGGARAIMREQRPPTNDAGNEFCVTWWTRGGCFPNCGRRATHVPFASAGERTRLLTYVRTHLQAPAAAPGAT